MSTDHTRKIYFYALALTLLAVNSYADVADTSGMAPDSTGRIEVRNPLIEAVKTGNVSALSSALASGTSATEIDGQGRTALHYAAALGDLAVLQLLLKQNGVDINATDEDGYTPLHRAAQNDRNENIRVLISAKADVARENKRGETPSDLLSPAAPGEIRTLLGVK